MNGIKITKLLIHESGTYNQQFRRPYQTNMDGQTLNALQERMDGQADFSPSMMSGIAGQFVKPTSTPERPVSIMHGWEERRARFMMEVEHHFMTGGQITEIILGYTSHMGLTGSGAIDPNMEFYVNSTVHVRNTVERTPTGNQTYSSVVDASHVLADHNWANQSGIYSPEKEHRMRPVDVFSAMSRSHLPSANTVLDLRTTLTSAAVKSRRTNSLASNYMSHILDNYKNANAQAQFGMEETSILGSARGLVAEKPATNDPFLSAISQIRGTPVGSVFNWRDLVTLDPGVDHVTVVQIMDQVHRGQVHAAGQTQHWGGADLETQAASVLSQAVPALLMNVMLTGIGFKSTNRTQIGGQMHTQFFEALGFTNVDLSPYVEMFRARLESEVLYDITYGNTMDYALEMRVDLLGETWIKISINGGPFIDYVVPSFCDSLTVPVLTSNPNLALSLANDFNLLFDNVRTDVTPGMTGNTIGAFGQL